MPLTYSPYRPSFWWRNAHTQTIYCGKFRTVQGLPPYEREQVELPDGDFVVLDWLRQTTPTDNFALVLHGLAGHTDRPHVKGLVRALYQQGYDVLAFNFRGNTEPNRLPRAYHSGDTGDVRYVLKQIQAKYDYQNIVLTGYSMGGNVGLKYLGEEGTQLSPRIRRAAFMSVPCDLAGCGVEMEKWHNRLYLWNFMRQLKAMIREKAKRFPKDINLEQVLKSKTFYDFDDAYTGPAHGYGSAKGYYAQASSRIFLDKITIPTLLLNAQDDSFLSDTCYPREFAKQSSNFHLDITPYGGHVGFVRFASDGLSWAEKRLSEFLIKKSLSPALSKGEGATIL
jgi:uncharacterized protein